MYLESLYNPSSGPELNQFGCQRWVPNGQWTTSQSHHVIATIWHIWQFLLGEAQDTACTLKRYIITDWTPWNKNWDEKDILVCTFFFLIENVDRGFYSDLQALATFLNIQDLSIWFSFFYHFIFFQVLFFLSN